MRKFIAVLGIAAVTMGGCAGAAMADDHVAVKAPAPAATTKAPPTPAIKDSDPKLKYVQADKLVTITREGKPVAKVTLASARYTKNSGTVVLSVAAARPFTIDPAMFTLYDVEGWENDPVQTKPVRFETGTGSLKLTFAGTPADPGALGWVPQNGKEAVAVWERS
ncbi:hypothetical protein KOI35_08980 [Actinoplanes bogorensis]|uniref:DUF4352 domain-containing protein n=1 Tax=Paractinoplanes bogorensis TaxID=1610840 RepID=A0ABS5YJR2_9ACTN|nr:hypothetical protein [Actinoplanes bogorensis]MBU2663638.1 hypothetical protein [Actinoplanes bogorensis]